jgi:hypothetical protein
MASTAKNLALGQRASDSGLFHTWLETRVRGFGNSGALKIWSMIGASLILAWLPAIAGVPI